MGLMDKIKGMVNPDNFDEEYEDGFDYENDSDYNEGYQTANITPNQTLGGIKQNSALELKVVRPERFDSVTQIADHLINGRTVVLNLEATNKETARRMIDFLSGIAYSIEGNLKKVANNTYVITPGNVAVSNEQQPQQYQAPQQNNADIYNTL